VNLILLPAPGYERIKDRFLEFLPYERKVEIDLQLLNQEEVKEDHIEKLIN
jgi:hypothetical protein